MVLVDPLGAVVLVGETDRLLHEARRAGRDRAAHQVRRRLRPQPVVGGPRPRPSRSHQRRDVGRQVDHGVETLQCREDGLGVEQVDVGRLATECAHQLRLGGGAGDRGDVVPGRDHSGQGSGADDAGATGEEDSHGRILLGISTCRARRAVRRANSRALAASVARSGGRMPSRPRRESPNTAPTTATWGAALAQK